MLQNREAALDGMTRDITAAGFGPGYWIDPSGKIYDVRGDEGFSTHYDWVKDNWNMLEKEYGVKGSMSSKTLIDDYGWTRVGDSSFGYISIQTKNLKNLPAKSLDSVLNNINNGKGLIVEDMNGGHVEINWIDEVYNGDIQKTVNKALQQKRLKKADLTQKGYWIDPSGKFYSVREEGGWSTHSDWVWTNREMLKQMYPDFPDTQEPYHLAVFLLDNGWVRIGDSFGADYGIEANDPSYLPSSVIDWANSGNLKAIKIDNAETRKSVIVELPVDDLQEAINNEFKMQKLAPVASLHDTGGWISPSGKYIETDDHYGYVDQHMDEFGLSQLKTMPRSFERISAIIRSTEYIFSQGWIRVRIWAIQ